MAQSVERLILGLSSGLDLGVVSWGLALSSMLGMEPTKKNFFKLKKYILTSRDGKDKTELC